MTIDAYFQEISSHILERLKKDPKLVKVFIEGGWNPNSDYWEEFRSSCTSEEFERFEKDAEIVSAESEASVNSYIQSRRHWHGLSFILTGYCRDYELPFLVKDNSEGDKLPLVNAVFGGTKIGDETGYKLGYDAVRYLTPEEVKEVAEALSKISEESFKKRYEQVFPSLTDDEIREVAEEALAKMPKISLDQRPNQLVTTIFEKVFRSDLSPSADDYLELVTYYKEAADKGKAMLLHIG